MMKTRRLRRRATTRRRRRQLGGSVLDTPQAASYVACLPFQYKHHMHMWVLKWSLYLKLMSPTLTAEEFGWLCESLQGLPSSQWQSYSMGSWILAPMVASRRGVEHSAENYSSILSEIGKDYVAVFESAYGGPLEQIYKVVAEDCAKDFDHIFQNAPRLTKPVGVWRGLRSEPNCASTTTTYTSSSMEKSVAKGFGPHVLQFKLGTGFPIVYLGNLGPVPDYIVGGMRQYYQQDFNYDDQKEVLLPPGCETLCRRTTRALFHYELVKPAHL